MLNWIWLSFILVAVLVGGFTGKLPEMTKGAFDTAETAVMKIALPLIGIWAIWLGLMRLAEQSGLVSLLARALRPVMSRLFPDVPADHPAIGAMVLNMAANMLGLGNAATPLGLRAMEQLNRLNPNPGVATNAMCTFLALNTASIQLIPTTAIGILAVAGSVNPTAIVPAAFLATLVAASTGVVAAKVLERLPVFRIPQPAAPPSDEPQPKIATPESLPEAAEAPPLSATSRGALAAYLLAFFLIFLTLVSAEPVNHLLAGIQRLFTGGEIPAANLWHVAPPPADLAAKPPAIRAIYSLSILAVPFLLSFFPLYAALRGIKVYEQFVEGAKEAFGTAQRVIPFLVAMLVSISLLRNAGVLAVLTESLRPLLHLLRFPPELVPMVLMRPLSGSATQGLFVELVQNPLIGPDSFTGRLAATVYGSTETTFYVLAVYFGAVAIRQTRHAVVVGLIADTVAVVASTAICLLLF